MQRYIFTFVFLSAVAIGSGCSDNNDSDETARSDGNAGNSEAKSAGSGGEDGGSGSGDSAGNGGSGLTGGSGGSSQVSYGGGSISIGGSGGSVSIGGSGSGGWTGSSRDIGSIAWTKQFGSSDDDRASDVATDSSGNVYITGHTLGALDGNASAGRADIITVKYNGAGEMLWTRQLGTSEIDQAFGVATDSDDNIYIAGVTMGDLDGDTNAESADLFVVKYNSAGEMLWTRQLGTSEIDVASDVATDSSGDVYVVGHTTGGMDGATHASDQDLFVVKYNSSGEEQWTNQLGSDEEWGTYDDAASGVATDGSGDVYVVGWTEGDLDGNHSESRKDLFRKDLFVVKYNSAGDKQWTRQLGSDYADAAARVVTDSSGYVYVAGSTTYNLDGNISISSYDVDDLFLIKYGNAGGKYWTRQLGSYSQDSATDVSVDSNGGVYVVGYTRGDLDGNTNADNSEQNTFDPFIVKYNGAGEKQGSMLLGLRSKDDDSATGVATDGSGNVFVTGYTNGRLDGNVSAGGEDLFLIKIENSP